MDKRYRIRTAAGKVYVFSSTQQFEEMVKEGLVDESCEITAPGWSEWRPVSNFPRLMNVIKKNKASSHEGTDTKKEKDDAIPGRLISPEESTPTPSPPRPAPAAAAPTKKPSPPTTKEGRATTVVRRKPKTEETASRRTAPPPPPKTTTGTEETTRKGTPPAPSTPPAAEQDKPPLLNIVPVALSLLPGLGQAYNLHTKKAAAFLIFFVASCILAVFKPATGAIAAGVLMIASMTDAYRHAAGISFFKGIWKALSGAVRAWFAVAAVCVWAMAFLVVFDTTFCTLKKDRTPFVMRIDTTKAARPFLPPPATTGTEAASTQPEAAEPSTSAPLPSWAAMLFAWIGVVFLAVGQWAGRKWIWARKSGRFAGRVASSAAAGLLLAGTIGLLETLLPSSPAAYVSGRLTAAPLYAVEALLSSPYHAAREWGKDAPLLVPDILEKCRIYVTAFGAEAADSLQERSVTALRLFFIVAMLLALPAVYTAMMRAARRLPPYADWLRIWREQLAAARAEMRREYAAWREYRQEWWRKRREYLEMKYTRIERTLQAHGLYLMRLEKTIEAIADKMEVDVPSVAEHAKPSEDTSSSLPLPPSLSRQTMGTWTAGLFARIKEEIIPGITGWIRNKLIPSLSAALGRLSSSARSMAARLKDRKKAGKPSVAEDEQGKTDTLPDDDTTAKAEAATEEKKDEKKKEGETHPEEAAEKAEEAGETNIEEEKTTGGGDEAEIGETTPHADSTESRQPVEETPEEAKEQAEADEENEIPPETPDKDEVEEIEEEVEELEEAAEEAEIEEVEDVEDLEEKEGKEETTDEGKR